MSRRRRRIEIQCSSLFVMLSLNLLLNQVGNSQQFHFNYHNKNHLYHQQQDVVAAALSSAQVASSYQSASDSTQSAMANNQLSSTLPASISNNELQSQRQVENIIQQQQQQSSQMSSQQQQPAPSSNQNNNNNNNNHKSASHHSSSVPSAVQLCAILPGNLAKQMKLCKLVAHSTNANEAVAMGTSRALAECRHQFKSDRWNCTHLHGDHHLLTSELAQSVGNRESGFVHAITAAGIVHSIATACSVGNLSDCACDKTRTGLIRRQEENWKWGGCSNNIRHGMLYAKHLVELLDAVHEHQSSSQHHHNKKSHGYNTHHHQSSQSRRWNQNQNQQQNKQITQLTGSGKYHMRHSIASTMSLQREKRSLAGSGAAKSSEQQQFNFCHKNSNLTQATHLELIKSLLSKNSLEKHQEFRLAMNMHNNKVGRLAVAKNMELRCRCHGLSGSCSLKTCWLTLPNFQVIGAYLKKKYENSVHLPSAINVNKLIPMMDRQEISSILSGSNVDASQLQNSHRFHQQQLQQQVAAMSGNSILSESASNSMSRQQPTLVAPPSPDGSVELSLSGFQQDAPVASAGPVSSPTQQQLQASRPPPISGHYVISRPPQVTSGVAQAATGGLQAPANHYSYYERHKWLLQQQQNLNNQDSISEQHELPNGQPQPQQQQNPFVEVDRFETQSAALLSSEEEQQAEEEQEEEEQEIQVNSISPMSQQQYQALLKDMKLCNSTSPQNPTSYHLSARDTNSNRLPNGSGSSHLSQKAMSKQLSVNINNNMQHINGQHHNYLRLAIQHLSSLLHQTNRDDLVHLHKSPNYCEANERNGFAGISSRVCSNDPEKPDNCDRLCCGRGYREIVYQHSYKCDCKFQYCCSIWCSVCEKEIKALVCN